jgi:serine/threonine protein kinase
MSANFYDPPLDPRHRAKRGPATIDLDTTTDVHEEHTTDLEPATADIDFVPGEVPRPTLAAATAANATVDQPRPAPVIAREPLPAPTPIVAREVPPPAVIKPVLVDARENEPSPATPHVRREPFISTPTPVAADRPRAEITVDVPGSVPSHLPSEAPVPSAAIVPPARRPVALKPVAPVTQRVVLTPGKVLCDRYLLEQVIGCGGTAIVFRARDMLSAKGAAPNIQVAVKTPRPELGDVARAAKRLKHEFDHARLLSHPSIVRVLDLHEDDGRPFMTMELIEGRLLSNLLRDWTMLPVSLAYKILRLCAEALNYAHSQNVVHGDFKPGNVFITADEGVRIVDFGTAAGPSNNDSRIPAGTPTYASPEVLSGETPDRRDDVFSFACVAYEVLTGQHPFGRLSSLQAREEGKIPPRAWNLSTSQWLSLLSALSWKREQRPTNVEELLRRLKPEQPVAAAPAPVYVDPEEVVPAELPADLMPKQRSWGFFAFIACALLVTYLAFQRQNSPNAPDAPAASIVPAAAALPPAAAAPLVEPTTTPATATTDSAPPEVATPAETAPVAAAKPARPAAPMSEISFESTSIVTSESSVAAVFLIKRSQPLSGRVSVSWRAVSGTADAGIDFASEASGTVTFADGQAQRAIYVPLRNDLLNEGGDETFFVELLAPKSARLGKSARAEAIIRDDD